MACMVWHGTVRYTTVGSVGYYDMVEYDSMIRHGMISYGMLCYVLTLS